MNVMSVYLMTILNVHIRNTAENVEQNERNPLPIEFQIFRGARQDQPASTKTHLPRLVVSWHDKFRRNFLIILNSLKYYKQC
jgi:hypothetical protein